MIRFRSVLVPLNAILLAGFFVRGVSAQQNALTGGSTASDSIAPASAHRADRSRVDDLIDPRKGPADPRRVALAAVTVSGKPGSLEVVGIPIPREFAGADSVRYRIVPVAGARVIGRTEGLIVAGRARPSSIMVTVSAPPASRSGRMRVASAEFDGPAGMQPYDVPIEMTVLAVRRVEVTVVDQVIGARRGDGAVIRYRAVNFGNVADTVRFTAELPSGWRLSGATTQALPIRGAVDGSLRVWVPQEGAPGTSIVRIVARSNGSIVSAADVRVEVETPNAFGAQGPKLTVGSAFAGVAGGPTSSAYVATLEGQVADSVSVMATGSWSGASSRNDLGSDLAFVRLGIPMTQPSFQLNSPALQLGLGLTSRSLSELTGTFVTGTGASVGTRIGAWQISGMEARPYVNSFGGAIRDTSGPGLLQSARVERALGESNVFVTAAHLDNPFENRKLDAASMGAQFGDGPLDGLTSELGYRRAAAVSGLGWSSEFRRQGDEGSVFLRAVYAPGGVKAYARATNELNAGGSRKLADWVTLNANYWQSGDRSSTIGASSGDGWTAGPSFSVASLGTHLMLQARGSSLDVSGDGGHFGSNETAGSATLDVRRGGVFFNGSGSLGRVSRSITTQGDELPSLDGTSSDLRGSLGVSAVGGTVRFDIGTQQYSGGASVMPTRVSFGLRGEHITIPVTDRFRVYANVEVERMSFSLGSSSPWSKRVSLTAPLGFGFDVTALAEQSPFVSIASGASPWMTAIRIEHSTYLPRPIASGETHVVFQDVNANGRRDRGETGVAGLIVRCGDRTIVSDDNGRFRCGADQEWSLDQASVPMGWVAPPASSDRHVSRDVGLIELKAIEIRIDLVDVDTSRVPASELAKLIVAAKDSAGRPWFARGLSASRFIFDALPPGRYIIDVDASGIDEPLRMRGTSEFTVGDGRTGDVGVTLTGRAMKIRALPPSQSAGSSAGDAPGKASSTGSGSSGRSSSKENKQ